ncbi:dynein light chain Tctex-type protein 2B-like [Bombus pascuorum]|uniref:dynein light chain Tctex-type protein 2B-like n=1 Tax=Bombus pascuorum TaxID=65598 RepID=UPI00298DE4AE|nr:dynein light chain Tctex-type protein 2B-like [Bombus pascuorum]
MSQQHSKNAEVHGSRFRPSNPNLPKIDKLRQVQFNEVPRYQNTYRLSSFNPFDVEVVDKLVMETMESKLSPVTAYHPNHMAKLCLEIGSDLQNALCKKDYDRYKLVTQVTIVQRLDQSVHAAFQSLWDAERDNYSYYVFENNHIYAWCCVFGLYYE